MSMQTVRSAMMGTLALMVAAVLTLSCSDDAPDVADTRPDVDETAPEVDDRAHDVSEETEEAADEPGGAMLWPGYDYVSVGSAPVFDDGIPAAPREFRAAWVATVSNIDWPSKAGLSTEEQQAEAIAIFDTLESLNMNAVIFQARPQADALYASELEPWSYFLTGAQGKAPDPWYDPLLFWIQEAHRRGMELHVWFNPYRAQHTGFRGERADAAPRSVNDTRPDITYRLANGMYWMDPAARDTQDHSINVVMDVVRRYDIDGVHFDDYFYPYASYNNNQDFPDDATWNAYVESGGTQSRGDWRRQAVDDFIERLYDEIKSERPRVKFGISPFGIWRPGHPPGIEGMDQYEGLYADAKKWLNEGWVDYYTPQLYWPTRLVPQSFPVLLRWWQDQNTHDRHLWPGLATFHVRAKPTNARIHRSANELAGEIMISRAIAPEGPGQAHFSMKSLMNGSDNLAEALRDGPYARKALIPASPWLDSAPPVAPRVAHARSGAGHVLTITPGDGKPLLNWVVYKQAGDRWSYEIVPAVVKRVAVSATGEVTALATGGQGLEVSATTERRPVTRVAVSAVDRAGNESKRTVLRIQ